MKKNKVLIPIDDTPFSLQILPYVQKYLDPTRHALILIHVEKEPESIHIDRCGVEPLDIYADQGEFSMRSEFTDSMRHIVRQLQNVGFEVTTDMAFGKPAQAIETHITYRPVDMIAMTTHGRTGLDRIKLGSVAEHIIHHCHIPVLLFHPTDGNYTPLGSK